MKKYLFSVVAIAAMLAMSAFTVAHHTSKMPPPGYFYKFVGETRNETNLTDRSQFELSEDDCSGTGHVCGVYLTTGGDDGDHPVAGEFDQIKDQIWSSEQAATPLETEIIMKN